MGARRRPVAAGDARAKRMLFGTAARTACAISSANRMRFSSEPPYWSVRWLETGDRNECSQIAVRVVQLDGVEADPHRALRRIHERLAHPRDVIHGRHPRHMPVRAERNGRWRDRLPRVLIGRQRAAALPRPLRRSLAAGMRDLDAELGGAGAAAVGDDARQRRLVVVGVEPQQPWVMRPRRSTCVASTMTRPAPELASMPRWARCQSVAVPSSALYWHIGDTTMRLVNSTLPSLMGVKRADMRFLAGAALMARRS